MTITARDIEAKAREIVAAVEETKSSARDTAVLAGLAVAGLVILAFVVGRRRGGRAKTLVEVYRV